MDLFWIFAIIFFTSIYGCGRWFYSYKQQSEKIKSDRKIGKRLNTVGDCVSVTQTVVDMNVEMSVQIILHL